MDKINLLVNLPAGFYQTPALRSTFRRLSAFAKVRKRSHDTPEQIEKDLAWADAVLMWSWPALMDDVLDKAPDLKFAAQLDVAQPAAEVALRRGLPISLAKGAWSPSVAEMALTLTLCTLRKVSAYHAAMRTGKEKWVGSFPDDIDVDERQLTGRAVGIVGLGAIGRRLTELLKPFGCELRVCDPYVPASVVKAHGGSRAKLPEVIRKSDVVILCAASNEGTHNLLGPKEIAAFRKGAVLVNVARSALVDTDALVARLAKGDMYAAIDVFDQEPLPRNHPLRKLPNAFLTPHRAGGVMASVDRILNWLIDDIEAFLAGRKLSYPLTKKMIATLDG
jgi:D-3-phosphoglycerate dehydrogenase / 2-oxoglutarate reductase